MQDAEQEADEQKQGEGSDGEADLPEPDPDAEHTMVQGVLESLLINDTDADEQQVTMQALLQT